jgi:hypothetical protein
VQDPEYQGFLQQALKAKAAKSSDPARPYAGMAAGQKLAHITNGAVLLLYMVPLQWEAERLFVDMLHWSVLRQVSDNGERLSCM